jgi:hypothetical protein
MYSTLNSIQVKSHDSLNISFYELSAAAVVVFLFLALTGGWSPDRVFLSLEDWFRFTLLALVTDAVIKQRPD